MRQQLKQAAKLILLSLIILSTWQTSGLRTSEAQSADDRTLPDLEVFTTEKYSGWAGSGLGLDIAVDQYSFLPQDNSVRLDSMPSLKVGVTGPVDSGGWWSALIAGPSWESYSVAPYMANGTIEFSVKGAAGGEQFNVGIADIVPGRDPQSVKSAPVPISEFITVSTDWQRVSIPLARFAVENPSFNPNQFSTIGFSSINTSPLTFWLADVRITSPDSEPGSPSIKINQAGYRPDGFKQVIVSGFADQLSADGGTPFAVHSIANNQVVFEGSLDLITEFDPASGERVLQADFSELTQPGRYYLSIDAYQTADSIPFEISASIYSPLVVDTMRYFYLQRAGIELDAAHAGPFARAVGHPQDAQAAFRSGERPPIDVSGGWYDAGDYGKYVNAGATAVSDLLWAYEMFPEQFPDNHLNIPESGNGVSDLLDEIRWELDWIMRMQDPESGGFYHMVQPTEDLTPDAATGPRFVEDVQDGRTLVMPTSTSGSATAVLAHAAVVFEATDPDYAQSLLSAAELGFSYLENNPNGVAPIDGPYSDDDDSDNRFWAATALYRATGDEKYHAVARSLYSSVKTFFGSTSDNGYGVNDMGMVGWLPYMFSDKRDPQMVDFFTSEFNGWHNHMTGRWEASTWNHTLLNEDYYWGSNYVALTTPLVMYAGDVALGQDTGTAAAISQQALDYLLGSNPLAFSYVSGYGPNSVENLYSVAWSYDGVGQDPAGVMVGGPNAYSNPLFYSNFPGKQYIDGNSFWTLNEHTVYWNSALVFHAAMQADGVSVVPAAITEPVVVTEPVAVTESVEVAPTAIPAETVTPPVEVAVEPDSIPKPIEAEEQPAVAAESGQPDRQTIILAAVIGSLATLATLGIGFLIWRLFRSG